MARTKATPAPEPEAPATPQWVILCDRIEDGRFDDGLTEIARTIQSRLEVTESRRARRLLISLEEGSRVLLTNGITPRYLDGMVGTIQSIDGQNSAARVLLDEAPVSSGRGRPSNDKPKQRLIVGIIHLMLLTDDDMVPRQLDASTIGDDDDLDDDDDEDDDD